MRTVFVLIDHPNLDLMLIPVIEKLIERRIQVKVFVTGAGKTELLEKHGIPYSKEAQIVQEFLLTQGQKLFLNAADLIPAHKLGIEIDKLCRNQSIPSLTLEHAPFSMGYAKFAETAFFGADKMALVGQSDYEKYLALGVSPEKLIVTGNAQYDAHYQALQQHKPSTKRDYIAFFGQNHQYITNFNFQPQQWTNILRGIYEMLFTNFPELKMLVKPHPAEPFHNTEKLYLDALVPKFQSRLDLLNAKHPTVETILNSAFVFTFSSSIFLESLLLNKSCILLYFTEDHLEMQKDVEDVGGIVFLTHPSTYLDVLNQRIDDIKYQLEQGIHLSDYFVEKYAYKFDGQSSVRVADEIEKMLNQQDSIPAKVWDTKMQEKSKRPIFNELGYERYVRLMGIAEEAVMLGKERYTLLDVGGEDQFFMNFVPNADYSAYDGFISATRKTPYQDDAFDVVIAADVLEHVPVVDRQTFLLELIRIAKYKVVFSFPAQVSEAHEKLILKVLPHHRWLQEHQDHGLPHKEEIDNLFDRVKVKYKVKSNHSLASWVYSVLFDHTNIAPSAKVAVNTFLQEHNFDFETNAPGYRYIYTLDTQGVSSEALVLRTPRISIVIPVFNKVYFTKQCLEILYQNIPTENNFEVIVVDNASSDSTSQYLTEVQPQYPDLRILTNRENQGFAKACNQGAKAAKGDLLLFLNNDTEVQPGWLEPLVDILNTDSHAAAVASKLVFPDGTIQHAGVTIIHDYQLSNPLAPAHPYYREPANTREANQPRIFQALTAACLLVRKPAFNEVGGFDETYWNGFEDVDFCFKLGEKGWRLVYQPASVVIHYESQSGPERFARQDENRYKLYQKWWSKVVPDLVKDSSGNVLKVGQQIQLYALPVNQAGDSIVKVRSTPDQGYKGQMSNSSLKISVISIEPESTACAHIRLLTPFNVLRDEIQYKWALQNGKLNWTDVESSDLIIVQRWVPQASSQPVLNKILGLGIPVVYETDDLLIDFPRSHPAYAKGQEVRPFILDFVSKVDAVTVATEALKSAFLPYNQKIFVLPNLLDLEIWGAFEALVPPNPFVTIGFTGTPVRADDVAQIEQALTIISQQYGDQVRFLFVGFDTPALRQLPHAQFAEFDPDYLSYAEKLKFLGIDIGLVSLEDNHFNRCKSNIKWLEYSAVGIAGIFSEIPSYVNSIKDGQTGLLVDNSAEAWVEAINSLVTHPDKRKSIVHQARQAVFSNFSATSESYRYLKVWQEIASRKNSAVKRRSSPATPKQANSIKVSIIIPTFNKLGVTRSCLESVRRHTKSGRYEIVFVDNGSDDGTVEFLQREQSPGQIQVLLNTANLGFARACNQGAAAAVGHYFLFLNNDTEVQPGWLDPLLNVLDANPNVAAVGGKLLYPDGTIQHAGVGIAKIEGGDPLLAFHLHARENSHAKIVNQTLTCQAVTAACMLVRKSAFETVAGFDEQYWNGYEDVDLCFKFQEKGWLIVYEPRSVVIHYESKSGPERWRAVQQNIARLHQKWLGKIKPDFIKKSNGVLEDTDLKMIKPYHFQATLSTTSIIILTHNQLDHTKLCLQSIEQHTPQPHELIIVDNGSTDGTPDYLRQYAAKHQHVRVVANKSNLGFSAGNNQGLALAKGEYVLLLNNDTVVTEGWLARMLGIFERFPDAGIVGPVTNYAAQKEQLIKDVSYKTPEELATFAAKWAIDHVGQTQEISRIFGFCMLIHREVLDTIGGLDERFGLGNFEDDDFCIRAGIAGFETRIARDVFIHHVGNQTFKEIGDDYQQRMERNWALFREKWGIAASVKVGDNFQISLQSPDIKQYYIPFSTELNLAGYQPNLDEYWWQETPMTQLSDREPRDIPGSKEAPPPDLPVRLERAQQAGNWPEAISLLQQMMSQAQDSEPANLWNRLGYCYIQNEQPFEAEMAFERGLELAPENLDLLTNLADLYLRQERYEQASDYLNRALRVDPDDVPLLLSLGDCAIRLGALDTATMAFQRVQALAPETDGIDAVLQELAAVGQ